MILLAKALATVRVCGEYIGNLDSKPHRSTSPFAGDAGSPLVDQNKRLIGVVTEIGTSLASIVNGLPDCIQLSNGSSPPVRALLVTSGMQQSVRSVLLRSRVKLD